MTRGTRRKAERLHGALWAGAGLVGVLRRLDCLPRKPRLPVQGWSACPGRRSAGSQGHLHLDVAAPQVGCGFGIRGSTVARTSLTARTDARTVLVSTSVRT